MFTKKSNSLEKLANGKYVFEIQPCSHIWVITVANLNNSNSDNSNSALYNVNSN